MSYKFTTQISTKSATPPSLSDFIKKTASDQAATTKVASAPAAKPVEQKAAPVVAKKVASKSNDIQEIELTIDEPKVAPKAAPAKTASTNKASAPSYLRVSVASISAKNEAAIRKEWEKVWPKEYLDLLLAK